MSQKSILPPLTAILAGAVGFALRKWQLSAGFERDTGLAVPGAPSALLLLLWSLAVAVLLALLCWRAAQDPQRLRSLDGAVGNPACLGAILLSAVLLLASAGAEVVAFSVPGGRSSILADTVLTQVASRVLPPLRILLCGGGVLAAGLWGRNLYTGGEKHRESLAILELCFLFSVWLISDYQLRSADPVVMDYVYEILAIVAVLMALYYLAGCSFGEPKPARALFFSLMGPYFCLVTLADTHSLADVFRYGFGSLFLLAHALFVLFAPLPAGEEKPETEADQNG